MHTNCRVTLQSVAGKESCSVMHLHHDVQLAYYITHAHKL